MELSVYKRRKKLKFLIGKASELQSLLSEMSKLLKPYKHFTAAKQVINCIEENELFLKLSVKKLEEELGEK